MAERVEKGFFVNKEGEIDLCVFNVFRKLSWEAVCDPSYPRIGMSSSPPV